MIKKLLTIIGLSCVIASTAVAQTETTTTTTTTETQTLMQQTISALSVEKLLSVTNWALIPYITYAPDISAASSKVGGGALAMYNLNDYVGAAAGVDYLGQWSLLSANLAVKYPIQVNKYLELPVTLTNLTIVPFTLGGIGTPFGGTSSQAATIWDVGAAVQFGHFLGGKFNTGAAYGAWENAGDYSGKRYHIFVGWSKGF